MALAEIQATSIKIDKLINKIEDGELKIPAFQRGFVWSQAQVIELLDSIYHNYPIGTVLLWNSNERLKSTRNVGGFLLPEKEPNYPVNYVLDGQQRISAIYSIFCKDRTQAPESDYNVNTDLFDIYFDFNDKRFLLKEELDKTHTNFPVNVLLNNKEFNKIVKNYEEKVLDLAVELQSQFQNYEIPLVITFKRTKEEVGTIFERINNTATPLTTIDLMVAWTWSGDFHLKEEMDKLTKLFAEKKFVGISEKIILQCLSAIIKKNTKTSEILTLKPADVRGNIELLRESMEKAIDYLATEFNILSRDFLPHSHQIVPITFFFSKTTTPNATQCSILKNWFWRTSFSRRYSASTDEKMNDDILFFDKVVKGESVDVTKYPYFMDETILINQKFSRGNPYTRAFLLLLAQKKPLNLVNGNIMDLGQALSQYNRKEYHHIFPKAYLKVKGVEDKKVNSICNYCFLPADSNKIISNAQPSDYIFKTVPSNKFAEILGSNLMTLDRAVYSNNDIDNFLKKRAQLIIQELEQQLAH